MRYRGLILTGFFLIFMIFLVLPLVLSDGPGAAAFKGNVTINNNATTTGANISAYILGTIVASDTIGDCIDCPSSYTTRGFFTFAVPCSSGDVITFTVYNVTVNEATQTCSIGSSTFLNLSITKIADSAVCAWSEACSGGYCCSGASEYHGNGIGTCQATACSAPTTPSSDSGGGGGGGGAGVVSESKYTGSIPAGESKAVSFTKSELKITSVEVTTSEAVNNMGITVKESSAPTGNLAIATEEGNTYKYLEITKTVEDKSIKQVKISFKVEKSWFESNGLNPSTTVLKKLVNNVWQDLPTSKVSEDATYVYFDATSETLSKFAITAKKKGVVVTPPTPPVAPYCGDTVCNATAGENCATCVQDCTCKSGEECKAGVCEAVKVPEKPTTKTLVRIVSIILIILILVIAIIFLSKRKK